MSVRKTVWILSLVMVVVTFCSMAAFGDIVSVVRTNGCGGTAPFAVNDNLYYGSETYVEYGWWTFHFANDVPAFLQGADYVRTANSDGQSSLTNLNYAVTTDTASHLYCLFPSWEATPTWLTTNFTNTGSTIGYQMYANTPGVHNIWDMGVKPAGTYNFGPLGADDNFYGIASAEVPEPSTVVLLATGLIGLLAYAWRKRR